MRPEVARLLDAGHAQPDAFTCGAQSTVLAGVLHDPARAQRLLSVPSALRDDVVAAHRDLTSATRTGPQLPWPRRLGTPPWAVARALRDSSAVTHRVRVAWPWRRARLYEQVSALTRAGRAVVLYVGSSRLPRHVVLLVPPVEGSTPAATLDVHDPATGRLERLTAAQWCGSTLVSTSWPTPWFVVVPTS